MGSSIQVEGNWLPPVGKWAGFWALWVMSCVPYCLCCFCCSPNVYLKYKVEAPPLSSPCMEFSVNFSGGIPLKLGQCMKERDWTVLCHPWNSQTGCLSTRQALDDTAEVEWLYVINHHMQLWPWDSSAGCVDTLPTQTYMQTVFISFIQPH